MKAQTARQQAVDTIVEGLEKMIANAVEWGHSDGVSLSVGKPYADAVAKHYASRGYATHLQRGVGFWRALISAGYCHPFDDMLTVSW